MKLVIGNRRYSSWSLRGWLACRQSGLPFTTEVVPLYGPDWPDVRRAMPEIAPSAGKVPILWHDDAVVWDSLAIMDYLADRVGRDRFWPRDPAAAGLARAMVAEMHAGFAALRSALPMNLGRDPAPIALNDAVTADINRVLTLWAEARARHGQGGPFLFGAFGAADIAFAPVALRLIIYAVALPGFAQSYVAALSEHAWIGEWHNAAQAEPWRITAFERAGGAA
ncbi:glutathione S-transferase family protein [Novosphingobium sp.]|uniref:glutathione S-transferase family protein n=1 Tax=Novosphingobium sp. TaxID=1874826 RepID=UPI00333ED067